MLASDPELAPPLPTGLQHSAWCISWSEAQRQAIQSDPMWLDGRYVYSAGPADRTEGVSCLTALGGCDRSGVLGRTQLHTRRTAEPRAGYGSHHRHAHVPITELVRVALWTQAAVEQPRADPRHHRSQRRARPLQPEPGKTCTHDRGPQRLGVMMLMGQLFIAFYF